MDQPFAEEPIDILLVEDNPGDVRLTQEAFNSIERDVEIHVVTNGEDAVTYAQLHLLGDADPRPDIILLDLNLPRIDGLGVLEILHDKLDYPPPPVLILSSSESADDIVRSYSKGCNAYLTKPNNMDDFMSMAQAIKDFWLDSVRHPHVQS